MIKKLRKIYIQLLRKMEILTSIAIYLTKYTGKSKYPIHPKHLINCDLWYGKLISKSDKILDIGCGKGNDAMVCAKRALVVHGIDLAGKNIKDASKIAKIKKVHNVFFKTHDANIKLPFQNNYFDKIFMFDVLEHLHRRNFALKEARRVLKLNGLLLLVTDNPNTKWKRTQKSAGLFYYADRDHKYEYPKEEVKSLLRRNQFEISSINPVTLDTPLKPFFDLVGGFSLSLYSRLSNWRRKMVLKNPNETTGFRIIAIRQG